MCTTVLYANVYISDNDDEWLIMLKVSDGVANCILVCCDKWLITF